MIRTSPSISTPNEDCGLTAAEPPPLHGGGGHLTLSAGKFRMTSPTSATGTTIPDADRGTQGLAVPDLARHFLRDLVARRLWTDLHRQHLQSPGDLGFRHGAADPGAGPDLRHHLGGHRSFRRLHHGPRLGHRGQIGQLSRRRARLRSVRRDADGHRRRHADRVHPRSRQWLADRHTRACRPSSAHWACTAWRAERHFWRPAA